MYITTTAVKTRRPKNQHKNYQFEGIRQEIKTNKQNGSIELSKPKQVYQKYTNTIPPRTGNAITDFFMSGTSTCDQLSFQFEKSLCSQELSVVLLP